MEELRNPTILASLALYMAACIGVGLWALRRTHSARDFFMAGRDLGVFVTGMAVFSSTLSGFGFVGGPGLVYSMGMSSVWIVIAATIGFSISFFVLGKRLRLFAAARDTISLPDAVAARYSSESSRFLTALAILLGVVGYLATQILAMAIVLQSVLERTEVFAEASLVSCMAVSCAVLVFYCVTGGIIASVYTDLVQGAVMVVASLLVFVTALYTVEGGAAGAVAAIGADDPEAIGPWGTLGVLGCLSWYFMFAVGGSGQPHVVTKLMMNKNIGDARRILPLSLAAYLVSALLWISIGLVMRALVVMGEHPELATADAAAPDFLQSYAHPILAGVVFAGLFAAIMSTADSFLNIGAAAVVHDIPRALTGRSLKRELFWARSATIGIALVATAFALYSHYQNERLIALLGAFGWGTFAAALVPTVAIGFNWKRATALAANVAIAVSLVVNFGVELFDISIPYGIHGGTVALVLSIVLFFGISLMSPAPRLDPDIEAIMDV
jgi:Na+/proline symporter